MTLIDPWVAWQLAEAAPLPVRRISGLAVARQQGLLPNSPRGAIRDMVDMGCLPPQRGESSP